MKMTVRVLALFLFSCGGSSNESINGTYVGSISGTQAGRAYSDRVTFTLAQQGSAVTGTWLVASGIGGTVSGTVTGSSGSFNVTQTGACPGSLTGSVTISEGGAHLVGSDSGTTCVGALSASFDVRRQ